MVWLRSLVNRVHLTPIAVLFNSLLLLCLPNGSIEQDASACVTPNQLRGVCTSLPACPSLNNLIRTRPVPQNIVVFLRQSQCGFDGRTPMVCCALENQAIDNAEEGDESAIPDLNTCGHLNVGNRIHGGEITDLMDYPWMALLEYSKPNGNRGFHCGGAMVTARYILTAAHCVRGSAIPTTWQLSSVRLGEWNTSSALDCNNADPVTCADPPLNVPVQSTVVHDLYDPGNPGQFNDIALVRLVRRVAYTNYISPICLPVVNNRIANMNFVGESLYISGWGKTETRSESDVKLSLQVPVIENSACNTKYVNFGVTVQRSQVCAGGRAGEDACRGDSGGPLMVIGNEGNSSNWFIVGVISFGPSPCGLQDWPGVYTKVGHYTNWLRQNIRN